MLAFVLFLSQRNLLIPIFLYLTAVVCKEKKNGGGVGLFFEAVFLSPLLSISRFHFVASDV